MLLCLRGSVPPAALHRGTAPTATGTPCPAATFSPFILRLRNKTLSRDTEAGNRLCGAANTSLTFTVSVTVSSLFSISAIISTAKVSELFSVKLCVFVCCAETQKREEKGRKKGTGKECDVRDKSEKNKIEINDATNLHKMHKTL